MKRFVLSYNPYRNRTHIAIPVGENSVFRLCTLFPETLFEKTANEHTPKEYKRI